ncbi:MAG: YdcF family protein [Campylobacteraceae bacterium]|nr:YdcF family protein [Campylobacteraceae bacterium]
MGFTLKKILSSFLMPLSIGLVLFIVGLIYLYTSNYKKAKIYLSISFLWIFMISYAPFSNVILSPLESTHPKIEKNISVKYILLLGGDFKGRSHEAIRLYHQIEGSKIITSGYPGRKSIPEALSSANKLIDLGIPKEDILMQSKPRDTEEEAMNIRKIVGADQFILITAAYHMPRALKLFKKHGLNPIVAPTNFLVEKSKLTSFPTGRDLQKTEIAFHEYLGSIWNQVKLYKQALFD